MTDDRKTPVPPPNQETPEFRPEGAEWEPAGGVVKTPPAPAPMPDDEVPTEGDMR